MRTIIEEINYKEQKKVRTNNIEETFEYLE